MSGAGSVAGLARAALVALLAALLLPAAGLTLVRLVPSDTGTLVRLVSFVPLAVPLYAGAALLLLGWVGRGWWAARCGAARTWGRSAVLLPVLLPVLGALGLHCWWMAPLYLGAPPVGGEERLTVMTSNLLAGQGDGATVVAAVVEHEVDVLVLTEVTAPLLASMDAAGLREALPHRVGEARPAGFTDGTVVLAREPVAEAERLHTDLQSWAVRVGEGERALRVLGVHPVAPLAPQRWREEHARILEAARRLDADLVVGDLNATLDHAPVRRLVEAGWRDAAEEANAGWQPTWPANGLFERLPAPPLIQIDHVLTGPRLGGVAVETVRVDGTDHLAVVAELARR